ncbi:MAG: hypothetical protein ACAF42_04285 [Limnothrix sp. BL-A-16]
MRCTSANSLARPNRGFSQVGNPSGTAELAALEEEDGDTGGKWILENEFPLLWRKNLWRKNCGTIGWVMAERGFGLIWGATIRAIAHVGGLRKSHSRDRGTHHASGGAFQTSGRSPYTGVAEAQGA